MAARGIRVSAGVSSTDTPLMLAIRSPTTRPAASAGLPSSTRITVLLGSVRNPSYGMLPMSKRPTTPHTTNKAPTTSMGVLYFAVICSLRSVGACTQLLHAAFDCLRRELVGVRCWQVRSGSAGGPYQRRDGWATGIRDDNSRPKKPRSRGYAAHPLHVGGLINAVVCVGRRSVGNHQFPVPSDPEVAGSLRSATLRHKRPVSINNGTPPPAPRLRSETARSASRTQRLTEPDPQQPRSSDSLTHSRRARCLPGKGPRAERGSAT